MAEARVERRLAAILAADIAGYSRLMGADEVGTLAALKAHRRKIVDPAIAQLFPDDYDALVVGREAVRRLSWRQLRPDAQFAEAP